MSVFTNPASSSRENARAYIRAVVALVEGSDPLEKMAGTAEALTRAVSRLSAAKLREPERPGKWSILQVVQHLADSELIFGYRIRRVLAEVRPVLRGYDQDLWAERLDYAGADVDECLAVFEALRAANLRLLRNASDADLQRTGTHEERGEEVLADMVRLYAGHDVMHLRQIERIATGESWE